jgi:hypothetical protein
LEGFVWTIIMGVMVVGARLAGWRAGALPKFSSFFVPHVDVACWWLDRRCGIIIMVRMRGPPPAQDYSGKERAIEQAIATNDTWQLRELALLDGGFLNGKVLSSCLLYWRG